MTATNCEACWHLWTLHGPDGCTGKVFPAHSLAGEPCPCEHTEAIVTPAPKPPREKLVLRDEVWCCVICGAQSEIQDEDEAGRPIAWVTHRADCEAGS